MNNETKNAIAPWLTVADGGKAVSWYKDAFGAIEIYRLQNAGDSVVVKLSVSGAEFWLSGDAEQSTASPASLGGNNIRMILTTANPDAFVERAIKAGATEIFPVGEEHGWRLGRLSDPFGLHWEIGYEL